MRSDKSADDTDASRMRAIMDNFYALMSLPGTLPGAEMRDDAEKLSVLSGLPIVVMNAVIRMNLPVALSDAQIDARIEQALTPFRTRGIAMRWYTDPFTSPANLGERLLAHGLNHVEDRPGMACDLITLPASDATPAPPYVTIVEVDTAQRFDAVMALQAALVSVTIEQAEPLRQALMHFGIGQTGAMRHFMALWDDRPVAASTLFLAAGAAGIYNVATLPEFQRRGIGAALMLATMRAGKAAGMSLAVLEASLMGYPLYLTLGFTEICTTGVYQWSPAAQ